MTQYAAVPKSVTVNKSKNTSIVAIPVALALVAAFAVFGSGEMEGISWQADAPIVDKAALPSFIKQGVDTVCKKGLDVLSKLDCQALPNDGIYGKWGGDLSGSQAHVKVHPRGCWVYAPNNARHWIQPDDLVKKQGYSQPICKSENTYSVLTTACGTDTAFLSNPFGHTLTSCEALCTDTELCDSIGFNAGTGNCVIRSNMYCDAAAGWVYYEQVVPKVNIPTEAPTCSYNLHGAANSYNAQVCMDRTDGNSGDCNNNGGGAQCTAGAGFGLIEGMG